MEPVAGLPAPTLAPRGVGRRWSKLIRSSPGWPAHWNQKLSPLPFARRGLPPQLSRDDRGFPSTFIPSSHRCPDRAADGWMPPGIPRLLKRSNSTSCPGEYRHLRPACCGQFRIKAFADWVDLSVGPEISSTHEIWGRRIGPALPCPSTSSSPNFTTTQRQLGAAWQHDPRAGISSITLRSLWAGQPLRHHDPGQLLPTFINFQPPCWTRFAPPSPGDFFARLEGPSRIAASRV